MYAVDAPTQKLPHLLRGNFDSQLSHRVFVVGQTVQL